MKMTKMQQMLCVISALEQKYARSILEGPGVGTVAVFKTEVEN